MKRLSLVLFFFLALTLSLRGQNLSREKNKVNKDVSEYVKKGLYIDASDLLLNFALLLEEYGDTIDAFDYFVRNGVLVDEHIEEMLSMGFTTSEYVGAWFNVFISAMEHEYDYNVLSKFFSIVHFLDKHDKPAIPHYFTSNLIRYQILTCNDNKTIDTIHFYSQKVLDIIKTQPITEQSVQQYIGVYKDYCLNRQLNSFKESILVYNYHDEIKEWHQQNRNFIRSLNPQKYKKEIQEYEMKYVQQLKLLASSVVAQNGDLLSGIKYHQEALTILSDVNTDDSLIGETAYCYAAIAQCYSILGYLEQSKTYSDSASALLLSHSYLVNFETIQTLIIIAENYYRINNYDLAAALYQKIIEIKKANDIEVSFSDWSTLFMYTNKFNPAGSILYKNKGVSNYFFLTTSLL